MRSDTSPLTQLGEARPSPARPTVGRRSVPKSVPKQDNALADWLDALLTLASGLADAHRSGWTANGRLKIGAGPRPALEPDQPDGRGARSDFSVLVTQADRWITEQAGRGPLDASGRVLAEALVDAGDAEDLSGWIQHLMTALVDRATRSRARLESEQTGMEGRRSALLVQRRLRARLAERLDRLDASMGALERAVALEETRLPLLYAEVRNLDELREASVSLDLDESEALAAAS